MITNDYRTRLRLKEYQRACFLVPTATLVCLMVANLHAVYTPEHLFPVVEQAPAALAPHAVVSVKKKSTVAPLPVTVAPLLLKKRGLWARMKIKGADAKRKFVALLMSCTHADQFIRLTKRLEAGEITELEFMEEHAKISREVAGKLEKVISIACALGVGEILRKSIVKEWTKPTVYKKTSPTLSQRIKKLFGTPLENKYPLANLITTAQIRDDLNTIIDSIKRQKEALKPTALFFGPPGTGKTLAARTIAGETGATFIEVLPADFERFSDLGERLEELERIFSYAEQQKKHYIIFFDEIEAMTQNRLTTRENKFLTKLLTLLSTPSPWFMFIAASNRPEQIDTALWNRMTYKIKFDLPTKDKVNDEQESERVKILKLYLKEDMVEDGFNYDEAAEKLGGMSARAIMLFVQRLHLRRKFLQHEKITKAFFDTTYKAEQESEAALKKYQEEARKERLALAGVAA